jgi:predicted MFS family arabinose efflux permease
MIQSQRRLSAATVAGIGLATLAAAMGIGRFAFTPLFPLMQQQFGVSLAQGGWLATANYIGYFFGALANFVLTPNAGLSARWGLLGVAGSTMAMGMTESFALWFVLRLLAGIASAFVLIGSSAWTLAHLIMHKRAELAGWVFAGVGLGMLAAGLVTLMAASHAVGSAEVWFCFGVVTVGVMTATWKALAIGAHIASSHESIRPPPLNRSAWILIGCYGAFGFGYIIPATFIPAVARSLVNDPAVFGWTWPLFGLAAAISTITVSTFFPTAPPWKVAGWSLLVMAFGVLVPALHKSTASLLISALCVGGTFMVMTMAGLQEARRIAQAAPTRLMSGLTGAFAIGQFAGPILVSAGKSPDQAFVTPSLCAAALLLVSACALLRRGG